MISILPLALFLFILFMGVKVVAGEVVASGGERVVGRDGGGQGGIPLVEGAHERLVGVDLGLGQPLLELGVLVQEGLDNGSIERDWILSEIPMRRFGRVEEIANVVRFLASEEARFVTGTELVVDGGMSVRCG